MSKNTFYSLTTAILLLVVIGLGTGATILYAPALMLSVAMLILALLNNRKKLSKF